MTLIENETMTNLSDAKHIIEHDIHLDATTKWCSLTNALISKFKEMTDNNPEEVIVRTSAIKNLVINLGWFTEDEFKNWEINDSN